MNYNNSNGNVRHERAVEGGEQDAESGITSSSPDSLSHIRRLNRPFAKKVMICCLASAPLRMPKNRLKRRILFSVHCCAYQNGHLRALFCVRERFVIKPKHRNAFKKPLTQTHRKSFSITPLPSTGLFGAVFFFEFARIWCTTYSFLFIYFSRFISR